MAKIILFLLLLIIRSNVYAWSCSFATTPEGWYLDGSMSCQGIPTDVALQNHYCSWYRPDDPYCAIYQVQACSAQVEYQTLSCPIHQSGAINQSRTYDCTTQTWGAWTTTSNNCTPDPPTCMETSEARAVACSAGYEGYIQEQRTSICLDPYGSPTWTSWSEIYNTCKMTATNINNPTSPISPISPTNPNSVISQSINAQGTITDIATVQGSVLTDMTTTTVTTQSSTSTESTTQGVSSTSTSSSSTNSTPSSSTTTTSGTEKVQETPKGKEIVPGFGIVMSLQLINAGYNLQQQQIQEGINLQQELDYGRTQEFTLSLLAETNVGDRFDSINRNRWASLLRNNPLQRLAEYD